MNPWWLALICPLCTGFGVLCGLVVAAWGWQSRAEEREAPRTVRVAVTRNIPKDIWLERILASDVKTANAWLKLSMGQLLGAELAPHTVIRAEYRPETQVYQVTAWVRVLPREDK